MLMLEVDGLPIKKNDLISLAEILQIKQKDNDRIVTKYAESKYQRDDKNNANTYSVITNMGYSEHEKDSTWYKKYINKSIVKLMEAKLRKITSDKFKE